MRVYFEEKTDSKIPRNELHASDQYFLGMLVVISIVGLWAAFGQ